jgi:hypothetical protein
MPRCRLRRVLAPAMSCSFRVSMQAQDAKQKVPQNPIPDSDADHIQERNEWFFRGRLLQGKPFAKLRRRAYQVKLQTGVRHAEALRRWLTVRSHLRGVPIHETYPWLRMCSD